MPAFPRPFAALAALPLLAGCGPELSAQDQAFLDAHNQVRASAQPAPSPALPSLHWSQEAASLAQQWAGQCTFSHNPNLGDFGENIAAFSPAGSGNPQGVVQGWAAEAQNYDYATDTCGSICGHYTQLVWRATTAVGCGRATCTAASSPFGGTRDWELWICDYDPAGNFVGQKPY